MGETLYTKSQFYYCCLMYIHSVSPEIWKNVSQKLINIRLKLILTKFTINIFYIYYINYVPPPPPPPTLRE